MTFMSLRKMKKRHFHHLQHQRPPYMGLRAASSPDAQRGTPISTCIIAHSTRQVFTDTRLELITRQP
ncbi:hypothetical protein TNCV_3127781 [Trichonephila clavipes]|nr:hypothetical protein TNCV_3127781 [Trichonephila clavipes]